MSDVDTILDQEEVELSVDDPTRSFVDALQSGDFNSAETLFKDILGNKVQDTLDAEKISVADQMFNGIDPEELDLDDEEEDLDEVGLLDVDPEETEEPEES